MIPNEAFLRVQHRYDWNQLSKSFASFGVPRVDSETANPTSAKIGYGRKSATFVRRVFVNEVTPVMDIRQKFADSRASLYGRLIQAIGDDCECD